LARFACKARDRRRGLPTARERNAAGGPCRRSRRAVPDARLAALHVAHVVRRHRAPRALPDERLEPL